MNAAAIVLRVLRNRTGATSAAEAIPWLLVAILAALVMWGYHHPRTIHVPGPTPSTVAMWAMRVS